MPEFYTWVILLINQSEEIGEKQLSVFGSRGDQNSSSMHVALSGCDFKFAEVIIFGALLHILSVFVYCLKKEYISETCQ